jgi:hypothetical protein
MFLRKKMLFEKKCSLEKMFPGKNVLWKKCSLEKMFLGKMFLGLIAAGRVAVRLYPRFPECVEKKNCRRQGSGPTPPSLLWIC